MSNHNLPSRGNRNMQPTQAQIRQLFPSLELLFSRCITDGLCPNDQGEYELTPSLGLLRLSIGRPDDAYRVFTITRDADKSEIGSGMALREHFMVAEYGRGPATITRDAEMHGPALPDIGTAERDQAWLLARSVGFSAMAGYECDELYAQLDNSEPLDHT